MKLKTAAVLMAMLMVLTGCAWVGDLFDKTDYSQVKTEEGSLTIEDKLRSNLARYTQDEVLWLEYGDFDGDSLREAFALTGAADPEMAGAYLGVPWFITEDYAAELSVKADWSEPELWRLGGQTYMKIEQLGAVDSLSRLFGVENSKVYEPGISGRVMELAKTDSGFTATASAYDAMADANAEAEDGEPLEVGHTYKPYWFYFEDGVFYEYGAIDTYKRADLREFETGAAVLDELLANGVTEYQYGVLEQNGGLTDSERARIAENAGYIRSIMRRANGLWHLNYYGADNENYYVTFEEREGDLAIVAEGSGYYLPALCEDIAVYQTEETGSGAESEPESSQG